jgi:type I restriction-modification system DNA methylase subunit
LAKRRNNSETNDTTSATVGYEAHLWQMADALRGSMDAAEYKHVVFGLTFLKYISEWGGERLRDDKRWQYRVPLAGNANFTWIQHIIHHLAPAGVVGFVLANGSMSSNQSGEGEIRRSLIEADLMDCMVALPGQLFYSTQISVRNWIDDSSTSPIHSEIWKN